MQTTYPLPSSYRQRGFTALESLLLLVILISGWVITAQFAQQQVKVTVATATSRQLKTVSRQAYQWVLDNWETVHRQFEHGDPQEPLDLLPLLPFSPPTLNPSQQCYKIRLILAANQWQLWVTTHGGSPMPTSICRKISAQVGESADYLTENLNKEDPAAAWIVKGGQGLWKLGWPDALGQSPKAGHLAVRQIIDLTQLTSTTYKILSRKPLASITKPNRLETDLQLNRHQLIFKNQQQTSQLSSQQLLFSQGSPSLQALKLTAQDVTVENSLLLGESTQNTLNLHHFLFAISSTTEKKKVSLLRPLKKVCNALRNNEEVHTHLQLRESQCTSQIHRFWGKLPYHERSTKENSIEALKNFATSVCQNSSNNQEALGRLFLVGSSVITEPSNLFICSKSPNGVAAFQLNKIDGYRQTSSKETDPTTTKTDLIKIKLPKTLSDEEEAADCLLLLQKITQRIFFFNHAKKKYSTLYNGYRDRVYNKILRKKLRGFILLKEFSDDTFNELFTLYCEPLDEKPPEEKTYSTYDEVKDLDPSLLIPYYQNNDLHMTTWESAYNKLQETATRKYFKDIYNRNNSERISNLIKKITTYFDEDDPFIKRVFMDSLIKLQQEHPRFFEYETNSYPSIIGIDLPETIDDTKQAEEVLSLLLIVIVKIEEKTLLKSTKKNFITNRLRRTISLDPGFYNDFKNSLSKINTENKDDFLKEFLNYYNKNSSLNNSSFFDSLLNKLPVFMQSILSSNNLYIFIERIKNIKNFPNDIEKDINNLLFDVVNTHYQDSNIIKIHYK
jgi:hypothetical protein